MALVTVKPKFQVTIPAKLRRDIDLREGDIMEASLVGDGILFKPKELVDRVAAANRIAEKFAEVQPTRLDRGRSEDEIMRDVVDDIARSRRERRSSEA
ncbi:MAG: AbrB/MazE/SpoVT family DNA-binding domain-containing protein [Gammaproteobacteria bacterium]|nr:AbrB/MazE/SpoVT family DNA-binding domain-containing protein [Gammaproteobacteria bacterium]